VTSYLDLEDLLQIASRVGFYVRDVGLLDSALARPRATLFGEDAYPTIQLKGAALMHSVIKNHAMVDGNKRTSWFALTAFLFINGYALEMSADSAVELTLALANDQVNLEEAARIIEQHLAPLSS
jgi:death-on-curing protein